MQTILDEIKSGAFADEWIAENASGRKKFEALRQAGKPIRSRRSARSCGP